jgi:ComF family protein
MILRIVHSTKIENPFKLTEKKTRNINIFLNWFDILSQMLTLLTDLFFPNLCPGCSRILMDKELVICLGCRHHLPLTNYHFKAPEEMKNSLVIRDAFKGATALFYFRKKGKVQQILQHLKYKNQQIIGAVFGQWLGAELKQCSAFMAVDLVIPVPVHSKRLKKRGYNQVSTFAKEIAKSLGADYIENVLTKVVHNKTQVFQSRKERWRSVQHSFKLTNTRCVLNKNVLLVDDLITTGSTAKACLQSLNKGKPKSVSLATIAITDTVFH